MHEHSEVVAQYVRNKIDLDSARPAPEWELATPISFYHDWQGQNPDAERETRVRLLWSWEAIYLKFECRYRELSIFPDSAPNGRRDQLWDHDVAEAFLQPDPSPQRRYKEFEVSPNGMWIDLDIFPTGRADLRSGMQQSVTLDDASHTWVAELAIPMRSLTGNFDPDKPWAANFYRVEGPREPRAYLAWQPTHTPKPDFHVPSAFGRLRFAKP